MLHENLKMLRKVHGYSQEEIAEKINVSRQAYAKWETGATVPDIEKCKCLADVYGTTIDSLMVTTKVEDQSDGVVVPPPPAGKNIWGAVTINERGQIVIPKPVRDLFNLTVGQRLIILTDVQEGIALVPAERFEASLRAMQQLASMQPEE